MGAFHCHACDTTHESDEYTEAPTGESICEDAYAELYECGHCEGVGRFGAAGKCGWCQGTGIKQESRNEAPDEPRGGDF